MAQRGRRPQPKQSRAREQADVWQSCRGAIHQPGFWDFNLGAYKSFKLPKEKTSLQFRAEFYNVLNHSNLYADIGTQDISSAGYIPAYYGGRAGTAVAERRNIQFALKFLF
jgi:hypothetical protein